MRALRSQAPTTGDAPREPEERDAVLVARARQGDAPAFALLYRRYVDRVYDFAVQRLTSREAAEDATQEVFYRALKGLGRCRDEALFAGWLFAIARHVVADAQRARYHGAAPLDDHFETEDADPTPEERALQGEGRDELRRAREECLGPKERELFDLILQELTDQEIAAALGRRHGAIRTAHWRLLAKLRGCLGVRARHGGSSHATP
jgi:RNA polymerase sigma-70 factor (ECF subfamily)